MDMDWKRRTEEENQSDREREKEQQNRIFGYLQGLYFIKAFLNKSHIYMIQSFPG